MMQLGTRWQAGGEAPSSVPEDFLAELRAVEEGLPHTDPMPMWTLTWLEGRPVAELDSGVEVSLDRNGKPQVSTFDPMD